MPLWAYNKVLVARTRSQTLTPAPDLQLDAAEHVKYVITVFCIVSGLPLPGEPEPLPNEKTPERLKGKAAMLKFFQPAILNELQNYQVGVVCAGPTQGGAAGAQS